MKFLAPPWPTPSPEHTRERAVLCVRVHVHAPASSSNDKDRKTKKQSAVETREDDHRRVHVGKQDVPCTHVGHCMCMHARANLLLFLSLNSARHVSLCAECVVYAACRRGFVSWAGGKAHGKFIVRRVSVFYLLGVFLKTHGKRLFCRIDMGCLVGLVSLIL